MKVSGQLHILAIYTTKERDPENQWTGGWVSITVVLEMLMKRKSQHPYQESNSSYPDHHFTESNQESPVILIVSIINQSRTLFIAAAEIQDSMRVKNFNFPTLKISKINSFLCNSSFIASFLRYLPFELRVSLDFLTHYYHSNITIIVNAGYFLT